MSAMSRLAQVNILAILMVFACTHAHGKAFYLLLAPADSKSQGVNPNRDKTICLVVKDARDPIAIRTQMCGVLRGLSGKPVALYAMSNQESLETIMAFNIRDRLAFAGYEIVKTIPESPAALAREPRSKIKLAKDDIQAAQNLQPKEDRVGARALRDAGRDIESQNVEFAEIGVAVSAPDGANWKDIADVLVVVEIHEFTLDTLNHGFTVEILGWSSVDITVSSASTEAPGKAKRTNVKGWGRYEGGVASKRSFSSVINKSNLLLLDRIEHVFLSDEFARITGASKE